MLFVFRISFYLSAFRTEPEGGYYCVTPGRTQRMIRAIAKQRLAFAFTILILLAAGLCWSACPVSAGPSVHLNFIPSTNSSRPDDQSTNTGTAGDTTPPKDMNTAGTVRVNNLANLEALLNIIANGTEIMALSVAGNLFVAGLILCCKSRGKPGIALLVAAPAFAVFGLAAPGIINWLVASARDANLFS